MLYQNAGLIIPSAIGSGSYTTLDNAGEYAAQLVTIKEELTIRYVHFYIPTVTASGDLRVSLCAIDSTSLPAIPGAILGAGNSAYVDVTVSTSGWKRVELGAPYAAAMGDRFFIKIEIINYVSTNLRVAYVLGTRITTNGGYHVANTGSVTATTSLFMSIMFESSTGVMINNFPVLPFAGASLTVNTGTTPDEVGNVITARYGCRVIGVVLNIDNDYAVDVVLYYGASTYTVSLVANERANVTNGQLEVYFTQAIDIKKGDSYRIAVKPTTSSSITAYDYTFPTSFESIAKSKYFADEIITKTSRSDAGGWTDDATKFVSALPIITGYNYGIIKPHGFNGF